jgi:hypothetical protein
MLESRNIITVKTPKVCREMEPNPSKDRAMHEENDPLFWNESIKFNVFLIGKFISLFFKQGVLNYFALNLLAY